MAPQLFHVHAFDSAGVNRRASVLGILDWHFLWTRVVIRWPAIGLSGHRRVLRYGTNNFGDLDFRPYRRFHDLARARTEPCDFRIGLSHGRLFHVRLFSFQTALIFLR